MFVAKDFAFDFEKRLKEIDAVEKAEKLAAEPEDRDHRFKTVVCTHWMKGLCMKGDNCDFLHEVDVDRMPECARGQRCRDKECLYRHLKDEERPLCNNFRLGFCPHGAGCRYQHKVLPPEECPSVADWMFHGGSTTNPATQPDDPTANNPHWRTVMCQHFAKGRCPFGDRCNFAHGSEELARNKQRAYQTISEAAVSNMDASGNITLDAATLALFSKTKKRPNLTPMDRLVFSMTHPPTEPEKKPIERPLEDVGMDLVDVLPDAHKGTSKYFVLRASEFVSVAASHRQKQWAFHPDVVEPINRAFEECERVFLFFAVDQIRAFSGLARLTSPISVQKTSIVANESSASMASIEWLRTIELDFNVTSNLESVFLTGLPEPRALPVFLSPEGHELPPSVGHALVVMMYRVDGFFIPLDEIDPTYQLALQPFGPPVELRPLFDSSPLENEVFTGSELGGGNHLVAPGSIHVGGNGYVFGIRHRRHYTEAMRRGILGAPMEKAGEMAFIKPGTIVLIYTTFDNKFHGVFEALSGPEIMWEPNAFEDAATIALRSSKASGAKTADSSLPVQIQFRVRIPCAPIAPSAMPANLFHSEKPTFEIVDVGKLQLLVNLFAIRAATKVPARSLRTGAGNVVAAGDRPPIDVPEGVHANEPTFASGMYKQVTTINVPFASHFKAPNRLIGRGGMNMKRIQDETGCTRARVLAGDTSTSEGVIELVLEAQSIDTIKAALGMAKHVLDTVMREWAEWQRNPPPPPSHGRGGGGFRGGRRGGGFAPRGGGRHSTGGSGRGSFGDRRPPGGGGRGGRHRSRDRR